MKIKGLSDNKITVQCKISNGLIGKARKRGSLSQENISKILVSYPDLNANWLMTGIGEMFTETVAHDHQALKLDVALQLSKIINAKIDNVDYVHIIDDDSMWPTIAQGNILFGKTIDVSSTLFQKNNIYIISIQHQILVRRVKKSEQIDFLELYSDNHDFETVKMHLSKIDRIAVVVNNMMFAN